MKCNQECGGHHDVKRESIAVKTLIKVAGAVSLLAIGYYFGVWGYFGLFMGESDYRDIGRYRIMFAVGGAALIVGAWVLLHTIVKGLLRHRH